MDATSLENKEADADSIEPKVERENIQAIDRDSIVAEAACNAYCHQDNEGKGKDGEPSYYPSFERLGFLTAHRWIEEEFHGNDAKHHSGHEPRNGAFGQFPREENSSKITIEHQHVAGHQGNEQISGRPSQESGGDNRIIMLSFS